MGATARRPVLPHVHAPAEPVASLDTPSRQGADALHRALLPMRLIPAEAGPFELDNLWPDRLFDGSRSSLPG